MSSEFDPYHVWLGIPPNEQPPHYYRLLALALFEGSPEVIENAAERQMAHVRRAAHGKHADESQRILSEIAAAQRALLDVSRKAKYDEQLRGQQSAARGAAQTMEWTPAQAAPPLRSAMAAAPPAGAAPPARWKQPPLKAPPAVESAPVALGLLTPAPIDSARKLRARAKRHTPMLLVSLIAIFAVLPLLALVAALVIMRGEPTLATSDAEPRVEPPAVSSTPVEHSHDDDTSLPAIKEESAPLPVVNRGGDDERDPFDDSPSFGRASGEPVLEQTLTVSARTLLPRLAFFALPAEARTPIEVRAGQIVKLKIDGAWRIGPGGDQVRGVDALYIAVGHAGQPATQFAQGAREVEFNVQKDGWLFMGVEDLLNFDNSGEMNVAVSVY